MKRIFDEYVNGHGFTEIAGGLMEEDVPHPGKAKMWYSATIRAILANRVYTGEYISGKTRHEMHNLHNMPEESWIRIKDHHEAIISEALFDAAQERLRPRDYVRQVVKPDSYGELVGIAFCGNCDKSLLNKDRKYFCKKCNVEIDEGFFHQRLISLAMNYQKTLPSPAKMNRTKRNALCRRDIVVAGVKQEADQAWNACDELMGRSVRGEVTNESLRNTIKS